jgi:hypothetical protein
MDSLRTDLIEALRSMARAGHSPSAMLRAVIARLAPETADRQLLVRYFSQAFGFHEGQGYTIFGWFPDATGELQDRDIDSILGRRIQQTRPEWDKPNPGRVDLASS